MELSNALWRNHKLVLAEMNVSIDFFYSISKQVYQLWAWNTIDKHYLKIGAPARTVWLASCETEKTPEFWLFVCCPHLYPQHKRTVTLAAMKLLPVTYILWTLYRKSWEDEIFWRLLPHKDESAKNVPVGKSCLLRDILSQYVEGQERESVQKIENDDGPLKNVMDKVKDTSKIYFLCPLPPSGNHYTGN